MTVLAAPSPWTRSSRSRLPTHSVDVSEHIVVLRARHRSAPAPSTRKLALVSGPFAHRSARGSATDAVFVPRPVPVASQKISKSFSHSRTLDRIGGQLPRPRVEYFDASHCCQKARFFQEGTAWLEWCLLPMRLARA